MIGSESMRAYAALYAPSSDELRRQLPDIGENLGTQLSELSARPSLDRCDRIAASLTGVQLTVQKLREAMVREGSAGER
jgi:hypothetical protein